MKWALDFGYLFAAFLFIVGLKRMSSPVTARKANWLSAIGMLIAIATTLVDPAVKPGYLPVVFGGIVVGSLLGIWLAKITKITSMPQMVALLNGLGGGASCLVAAGELVHRLGNGHEVPPEVGAAVYLSSLVGGVTLSGSLVAFAKLQELMTGKPISYPFQKTGNLLIAILVLSLGIYLTASPGHLALFALLNLASLALGVLLVIPIGGADMPVVISLLNSYSGIAAAFTGFVINNKCLVITGALVGASGIILTQIMCKGMNRSIWNVLFGALGKASAPTAMPGQESLSDQTCRQVSPEDAAMMLSCARQVVFVPGYGLAVAQAQHEVRELSDHLQKLGIQVKFAIHPVAGRMPGHMNVLLAEANVPYPQLLDMDQINPEFERADVSVVIGANDVVNPAARNTPSSPIYGMPILDVDKSQNVIVLKRGMNPGFAGIENELFYSPRTQMLFGDAKASLRALLQELKTLQPA